MKIRRLFFVLGWIMICSPTFAQYFNAGQDHCSIRWKQIKTVNFQVIFPEEFEKQGKHVAGMLETAYQFVPYSLNHSPKKISVILHTGTVKSNAFVGWCPSRIEMYTTPNQGIYSQDWLEQLCIHEYRHMVQVSKIESEMPQLLKILFGEHAAALLTGIHLPFWFIEGDAVAVETGLSEGGRGRLPDFHRELRAQLVEKGKYSYDKAYLGSFRDNVANHYSLGHLLVAGAREKYDKLVWDSVVSSVAAHPFRINSFSKGLKETTGLSSSALYNKIFDDLTTKWRKEDSLIVPIRNAVISPEKENFTSYITPVKLSDGSFFAERLGSSDINRFVSIKSDGKEEIIFTPGYHFEESVAARHNIVIWSERIPHIRFDHADRSLLRIYDVDKKKLTEYCFDSKIFAPSLSVNLDKAVVVEADDQFQFYLSEIDLSSGRIIDRYKSELNGYFINPSYSENSNEIITVILKNNQKGIIRINRKLKTESIILPFANQEIKRPIEHGKYVFFIGGNRGIDDLYAIDTLSSSVYRVITSRFGISDFSFDGDTILYSDYSSNGFKVRKTSLDISNFIAVNADTIQNKLPFASTLAKQEKSVIDFSKTDQIDYHSVPYKKIEHLLNFHSWAPISIDPYTYSVYPGVSLMSQNMLNTTESIVGYRYKWEEEKGECYINFKYMAWFPIIGFQVDYGRPKSYYYELTKYLNQFNQVVRIDTARKEFAWNEANLLAYISLPLNFSKGKQYRGFRPEIRYRLTNYKKDSRAPENFPDGTVSSVDLYMRYYSILNQSQQQIYPAWGLVLDAGYFYSLGGVLNFGNQWYGSANIYLPGFFKNHGIKFYGGWQLKNQADFSLNDRIRLPRGFIKEDNIELISIGADYKLPISFPDFRVGGLLYIKKINAGLFYDQAFFNRIVESKLQTGTIKSSGIEVTFNTNFFRFFAPVDIGFRTSYLFNQQFKTDFLFNISFSL